MKNLIIIAIVALMGTTVYSQNKSARALIEVDGVCMMCKERIEKASIKTKGVKSAVWNVETHELALIYDERKTSLKAIQASIAAVGHDTQDVIATEVAYNSVHPCCKYRDDKIKDDHKNK